MIAFFISFIGRSYWVSDGFSAIIFVKHVMMSKLSSSKIWVCAVQYAVRMQYSCCFVVKAPENAIMRRKQQELGQQQKLDVLLVQNWLLCSHPWPNMYKQCRQGRRQGVCLGGGGGQKSCYCCTSPTILRQPWKKSLSGGGGGGGNSDTFFRTSKHFHQKKIIMG